MIKKSFNILKNNLIYIQPLILFILFAMTMNILAMNKTLFFVTKIFFVIVIFMLFVAFCAGWLHVNKLAFISYNENDTKEEVASKTIENFKKFFEGVGINFVKTLGALILFSIIGFICLFLTSKACIAFIGEPTLIQELPKLVKVSSQAELLNLINGFSEHDIFVAFAWTTAIYFVSSFLNFFGILYLSVNIFENINIFKSLWETLKFLFKNILGCIKIMLFMFFAYFLIDCFAYMLGTNSISFVILIILFCIYLNYYVILVFCFYNEKTKNNSNIGTELLGEDESCD